MKTEDLVHTIRAERSTIVSAVPGATFEVTGTTALNIDVAQKVQGALVAYLVVVVGMAFVPAVLALLGDKVSWLPRRLDRILPGIDVEGEALSRHHSTHPHPDESPDPTRISG